MNSIAEFDAYWLKTVAGIAATEEDVQKMDECANDKRAYRAAMERRAGQPRRPFEPSDMEGVLGREGFLSREECEERSRNAERKLDYAGADLMIVRMSEDVFVVRCFSDAAKIAFGAYLPRHAVAVVGEGADYVFRLHEVEAIGRVAAMFKLKCAGAGGGLL